MDLVVKKVGYRGHVGGSGSGMYKARSTRVRGPDIAQTWIWLGCHTTNTPCTFAKTTPAAS
jgi:hypothetical protein